jgi:hypothetical protein
MNKDNSYTRKENELPRCKQAGYQKPHRTSITRCKQRGIKPMIPRQPFAQTISAGSVRLNDFATQNHSLTYLIKDFRDLKSRKSHQEFSSINYLISISFPVIILFTAITL